MRKDMHEVLIERPRRGHRRKTHRGNKPRVSEWTGEDGYADSYRPRRHRTKYFDDLLAPLERWLRKQVGRPWDKVWSEIVAGIDSRSVVGQHLLTHVRHLVSTNCGYDEQRREVMLDARHWSRRGPKAAYGLYVDPRSGLLRWRKPLPRKHCTWSFDNPPDTRPHGDNRFRAKIGGLWFELEVRWLAGETLQETPFDFRWNDRRCLIVHKHSLNSRALRAAGLTNDA
jgi:hypothetical protein